MRRALRRASRLGHSLFSGLRVSQVTGLSTGLFLDLDARHDVTLSGSDVTDWADGAGTGNDFAEATNRPVYSAASSNWGGRPAITYTAANTDKLVSADAAATWKFLHDGTGMTIAVLIRPTDATAGRILSTAAGGTQVGITLTHSGETGTGGIGIGNGTGFAFPAFVTQGRMPINGRYVLMVSYKESETDVVRTYLNGVLDKTSQTLISPSAANPVSTLRLGVSSSINIPYGGDLPAVHIWNRYLSMAEAALHYAWAKDNWGV